MKFRWLYGSLLVQKYNIQMQYGPILEANIYQNGINNKIKLYSKYTIKLQDVSKTLDMVYFKGFLYISCILTFLQ